ncbi:MAG TPA: G1 family glutamic endopeptidase [Bryobacteraceae bacterium]|nr:G1 family glutamic endopeptidase [Bryobacteraceae bacterium]
MNRYTFLLPALVFVVSPGFRVVQHRPADRHAPIIIRHRAGTSTTSSNWSGYAVTGANGSVSDVQGTWMVPSVICPSSGNQYAAFWVGIDGYASNTVEQIGTEADCQSGSPIYYAWYEFYPHLSYYIAMAIHPGDIMQAHVSASGGNFIVTIKNVTTGASFTTGQKMANAKMSSAEWIAEAPYSGGVLPLSDFGTVNFSGVQATVGKTTSGLAGFNQNNVFDITMDNPDGATAVPSSFLPSTCPQTGSCASNFGITYYPPAS